jgi:hypothetical protein
MFGTLTATADPKTRSELPTAVGCPNVAYIVPPGDTKEFVLTPVSEAELANEYNPARFGEVPNRKIVAADPCLRILKEMLTSSPTPLSKLA